MEPYPKSRAKELHQNEIQIETEAPGKVAFVPFLGISPFRYRDIFQKGNRKNSKGDALRWVDERPTPIIETPPPAYPDIEIAEYSKLFGAKESTNSIHVSSGKNSETDRWRW
jgi:hypothetical protein